MPYDNRGRYYEDRYDGPARVVENHYSSGGDRYRDVESLVREGFREMDKRFDYAERRSEDNRRTTVQASIAAGIVIVMLFIVLIFAYFN